MHVIPNHTKKPFKTSEWLSEPVNRIRTDNTMTKTKKNRQHNDQNKKEQTTQ